MMKENEALTKILDALCAQNPTEEQKMICALIKQALQTDDIIAFINEVQRAFNGFGKVSSDTVKGAIEYAKAHNEVQIRKTNCSDEQKDEMTKQEAERLTRVEVWILGALAHLGLLQ